ncbi:hypothetical protein BJX70DRAFT_380182 [Aspergillus crustosus]
MPPPNPLPSRTPSRASSTSTTNSLRYQRNRQKYVLGDASDMVVVVQGFVFNLHKSVVCPQSAFFDRAINGHFQESEKGIVCLQQDELGTMERVFSYLYLKDYDDDRHVMEIYNYLKGIVLGRSVSDNLPARSAGSNHIQVFIAADTFIIPRLKELAADKFHRWCLANWDSDEFLKAVREVESQVPHHEPRLLHVLVDVISANMRALDENKKLDKMVEPFGRLGYALLHRMVEDTKKWERRHNSIVAGIANTVLRRPVCSNQGCLAPLDVRLEQDDFELRTVRCAHCRERQWQPKGVTADPN